MPPAPQTPQIQVSHQEDDLITFTPFGERQVPQVQGAVGIQEQPRRQRSPRKKKNSEWTLNQRQFDQSKTPGNFTYSTWRTFECVQRRGTKCVVSATTSKKKRGESFLYQMW